MNDAKRKLKNRLWMVTAFIILFLQSYILAGGAVVWVIKYEGVAFPASPWPEAIVALVAFINATVFLATTYFLLLRPLDKIIVGMQDVAKGDFSVVLKHKSAIPGLRKMRDNFNTMTQELSGMNTLSNDFIVNVSHEFKTPISAIEGYAALLQKDDIDEETRKKYLEKIVENARNLSDLTGNILRLSKLEHQEILTEETFRLDEQIRRVLLLLEKEWEEKHIVLDLDLPRTEYRGNRELMRMVWHNLIGNAIKYSYDGGTVGVSIKSGEKTVVTVTDNGIGIDEKDMERVFEKFFQADKSRSSGNGLGLALVKKIVELHGGKVWAESSPETGTRFTVEL